MKKVMFLRSAPYDENPNDYNVQGIGLGKAFCRLGYDFDFVNDRKRNQENYVFYEYKGCKARLIEYPRFRFLRWGINTAVCKKEFLDQYDIIISREYNQIMTYLASKNTTKLSMYSGPYYNMFMFPAFSPVYDFLFTKKMDRNIKYKFVKSVLAKRYMEKKGYTNVINVGVGLDTERFDHVEIKPETEKLMEYMKTHRCILYVGALSDRKNYPFLLEIYERLLETEPDVKFVIIGKSVVSAFEKLIGKRNESYAEKYNQKLSEKVKAGIYHVDCIENPQLKYIYPYAQVFLLPSKLEIFGMVLLEAMYLGAPVVSSRNGGSLTLMKDGTTGCIVTQFDADKWVKAIKGYLNNESYRQGVIERAKKMIQEEYTWDAVAKKMLEYIES